MIAYRIADARHPIYDGTGAMLRGGRWNSIGRRVIYAAESYAGAMLEILVHANLSIPPKHQQVIRITIPNTVRIETLSGSDLPGWDAEDLSIARAFGDRWIEGACTPVLRVPSVVTEGREYNILINPFHPQAPLIKASTPELSAGICGSSDVNHRLAYSSRSSNTVSGPYWSTSLGLKMRTDANSPASKDRLGFIPDSERAF